MADLKKFAQNSMEVVVLAITVTIGLAILGGFTGVTLINATEVGKFIEGLGIFGDFIEVIVLAIVGFGIFGFFRGMSKKNQG